MFMNGEILTDLNDLKRCFSIDELAVYLLHCRGIDGRLFAYYNKDTPGPSFQLSGKLCRTDEILVFHRQEVSPTPHSFVACRFLVRIVPCHVELSGFQDGAGAFLCGKQYHRNVGSLRHSRGTDRFFHRKIHQYGRGETTYLYRMFADNQRMDSALCGTI